MEIVYFTSMLFGCTSISWSISHFCAWPTLSTLIYWDSVFALSQIFYWKTLISDDVQNLDKKMSTVFQLIIAQTIYSPITHSMLRVVNTSMNKILTCRIWNGFSNKTTESVVSLLLGLCNEYNSSVDTWIPLSVVFMTFFLSNYYCR